MPAVALVTQRFERLARSVANSRGAPNLPMVILPPTEITEYSTREETRALCQQVTKQVVDALSTGSTDRSGGRP